MEPHDRGRPASAGRLCPRGAAFAAALWLVAAASLHAAEEFPDPAGTAAPQAPGAAADAGLDDLLSMDVAELGNVSVNVDTTATFSDPVVESVSRVAEKSSKAAGVVQVITADQIRAYGGKTLREVLERATSIWTPNSLYAPNNVTSIRGDLFGHYDNHVLLLLNNRPFKDPTQGGMHMAIYNAFPIETLERIEIIRGPGSVLYGTNAYAGVINLITKSGESARTGGSVLAGSNDAFRTHATLASGEEDHQLYLGAMQHKAAGYGYAGFDEAGDYFSKLFGNDDFGVVGVLRHGNLVVNSLVAQTNQGGLGTPFGTALDNGFYTSTRAFIDCGYTIGDASTLSLETHLTYNYSDQSSFGTAGITHFIGHDYLAETILRAGLTERLNLTAGGTCEVREGSLLDGASRTWYSVYGQLNYEPTEWLTLTGGAQLNLPGDLPGGTAPRAGAIVGLTERCTAKLLYGNAFRSPSSIETDFQAPPILVGNPNLAPETIDTFDAQLAYAGPNSRVALTYFHSTYTDIVARDTSGVPITYDNLGNQEIQGVEFEASAKVADRLRWTAGVTWQENHSDAGVPNVSLTPTWMAKLGVAYDNGLVSVGLFDSYFSAPHPVTILNPAAAIVNPVPTSYHSMSLNTRLDVGRLFGGCEDVVEWQLLVQNLLDEGVYHPEFSRRQINSLRAYGGRTFYSGVTINY